MLLTGAALAFVGTRQVGSPWFLRGVLDHYVTAADDLAGGQFHLRLIGWQAIELIDHLLDFAQVDHLAFAAGKRHGQLTR